MKVTSENEQVRNWLTIIMGKPQNDRISEFFYFDHKDNEFFSILTVDYILFEEDWTIPEGTSSSYSGDELLVLADRMRRIESEAPSILYLPPKGLDNQDKIDEEIEMFLNEHDIDLNSTKVWEVGNEGESHITMDLTLDENNESETRKKWWEFWK